MRETLDPYWGSLGAAKSGGSMTAARAPATAKACADVERQAGVADGRDVLVVEQILSLGVDVHPFKQLEAAAQIELGVAVVEIAIGQQEAVAAVRVFAFKEG